MINDQYILLVITGVLLIIHGLIEPFIHRAIWETQMIAIRRINREEFKELNSWNNTWHKWFAIMWTVIYISIILITGEWWVIASGWFRLSLFPVMLNWLKGEPIYHMSKDGIDKWVTVLIKSKAWMVVKLILTLVLIFIILQKELT